MPAPRRSKKAQQSDESSIEESVTSAPPGAIVLRMSEARPLFNVIKKMTEIVPKSTGDSNPLVLMRTVENGLKVVFAHFGYGAEVIVPATLGEGAELNCVVPFDILKNLRPSGPATVWKIPDVDSIAINAGGVRVNALVDLPDTVERQIPTFLTECYDQFELSENQFDGLLKQVIFSSTDISVKGSGIPVQIKSDAANNCYHIVARDSAFGVIKRLASEITAEVDVTLSHQFLKVLSDTLRAGQSVRFAFSEDMLSCRATITGAGVVWAPVPMFEVYDLLAWREAAVTTETPKADLRLPFDDLLSVLEDITPHFKLDGQTNNITMTFEEREGIDEIKLVFSSNRIAVGGRVRYEKLIEATENNIVTDGLRMLTFLRCGKATVRQQASVKLIGNHMFLSLPESDLDFILPLR